MPKGIKPKTAINKILGEFLAEKGFTFNMAFGNESYCYIRNFNGAHQQISIDFSWTPEFMVQEYYRLEKHFPKTNERRWESYSHTIDIELISATLDKSLKKLADLRQIILHHKYPHLLIKGAIRELPPGLKEEWENIHKTDPIMNRYFLTQEELEERLLALRQALEEYGMPFFENDDFWPWSRRKVEQ